MAVEGDKPPKSDDEPDYKKWSAVVGTISGVLAIFVALNALTGFNPFKELGSHVSATPSPTSTPFLVRTTSEVPTHRSMPTTEEAEETEETTETATSSETTRTTAPAAPVFRVRSVQWDAPCSESSCSMSAVFRNDGGEGAAIATFLVMPLDEESYLAKCSVVLRTTAEDGLTSAGCTASSGTLQLYSRSHRGSSVRMKVEIGY